ncbi:40S ribosomal protein S21 [Heracleum sosnowskyi]|uniref:40S ribosomal protein S21 n=1 Tax=Heracleum sosnowskyi TaxID=360622 RepID=A0AAD8IMT2_9APIA|nr:40S ribosomal protein S21 [Heracleum sosnowskyi]
MIDFDYLLSFFSMFVRYKKHTIGELRHFTFILPPISSSSSLRAVKMMNDEGQNMDLYIPRKCSATNRLITSKDHASVQINVGHLDERGIYSGGFTTFALCGFVRAQGDADSAVDRLWQKKKAELKQ